MADQPAPIIIKRKKVIAGGHHGGAWKVAIWRSPIITAVIRLWFRKRLSDEPAILTLRNLLGFRATVLGACVTSHPMP